MYDDMNSVSINGRLTRDAETKTTPNGTAVASFGIAVTKSFKKGEQWERKTKFFNCVAWSKLGESASKHLKKGDAVSIQGELDQRTWDDRDTGAKRSAVEIVVKSFQKLGGSKSENTRVTPQDVSDTFGDGETHF